MKQFVFLPIALTLFAACQTTPVQQPSPSPSTSPSSSPSPSAMPSPVASPTASSSPVMPSPSPSGVGPGRIVLPTDRVKALGSSFATGRQRDLTTTVRFEIRSLNTSAQKGEALAQWRFSAAALRARTSPLELDAAFLAPGDNYGFTIEYVNDRIACRRLVAWDSRSLYSGELTQPGENDSYSQDSADTLNLNYSDYPAMDFPMPVHGEVRLPDGTSAMNLIVEFESLQDGTKLEAITDAKGYYVSPYWNNNYRPQIKVRVRALSDRAVFRTYETTLTPPTAAVNECDETFARHDIQLQAR